MDGLIELIRARRIELEAATDREAAARSVDQVARFTDREVAQRLAYVLAQGGEAGERLKAALAAGEDK
jgi:hypothetical protein